MLNTIKELEIALPFAYAKQYIFMLLYILYIAL